MDVKEFVSESIKQVFEGILSAQEHLKENKLPGIIVSNDRAGDYMQFDIAITVDESNKNDKKVGGSLKVASIVGIGADGSSTKSLNEKTVSRLQFKIYVSYPRQKGIYSS